MYILCTLLYLYTHRRSGCGFVPDLISDLVLVSPHLTPLDLAHMYRHTKLSPILSTMHYTDGESAVYVRALCVHHLICTNTNAVGEGSYLT